MQDIRLASAGRAGLMRLWFAIAAILLSAMLANAAQAASATSNGITFSDLSLVQAQRGVVYETMAGSTTNLNTRVSGGTGPYTYALVSGSLPTGFNLSRSGQITGVNCVDTNGTFKFTVDITDSTNTTGRFNLAINMTAGPASACSLALTPPNLTDAIPVDQPYSRFIGATGGTGPYTYTVASGTLPTGLFLDSATGEIYGTPTVTGTSSFSVRATDSLGSSGFQTSTITVTATAGAVVVGPATLPVGTNGSAYSATITPSGGTGPYVCTVSAGTLPAGLTLTNNELTGTPTAAGNYNFTITCTDSLNVSGSQTYSLTIDPGAVLALSPTTLPNATNGTAYSQTLTATGGTGTGYVFTVDSGTLPTGLTLSAGGVLSGTPTAAGTYTFTAKVVDSAGNYQTREYTLTVDPGAVLALSPTTLPNATNGTAYSQTLTATGGTGTGYVFTVDSGTLPTGLTLSAGGVLSGTPTAAGTYTFTAKVVDSAGNYQTREYTLTVDPGAVLALSPTTLPNATNGTAYSQTLTATGGTGTGYVFTVDSGTLPTGLTLSAGGVLSGTPTAAGTYTFTVRVVDSAGNYQTREYTLTVDPGAVLALSPTTLPNATNGTAYSQTLTATGGTGTGYVFTVDSGTLPAGLTLSAGGVLSGTPTAAGTYTFTVRVVDSAGNYQTREYTLTVDPGAVLALSPTTLPNATNGTAYSQTLTATGGTGTGYVFTVDSGTLPTGLTLSAGGVLSGTPTAAGTYTFTVRVVDSAGNYQTREYTVTVDPGAVLALNPATLPNGTNGTPYSQSVTATGGTGTGYTYTRTSGALPTGLTLGSANGLVSGTPTAPGSYTFTVRAVDSAGNYQSRSYTIVIDPGAVLNLGPTSLAQPTQSIAYSASVVAAGGSGTGYRYSIQSGALPQGLTLNPTTGAITGETLASGTFTFTVRAVDSQGNWGTRTYTFTVRERPDPTTDREVMALSDGQFRVASRFAENQIGNVMRHAESLHGGLRCGVNNNLKLNAANPANGTDSDAAPAGKPVAISCDDNPTLISVWAAGSITRDTDQLDRFKSDGITVGLDAQLGDRVIVGGAFGLGWGNSRIGTHGTATSDDARTAMAYGSVRLGTGWYLDLAGGKTWTESEGSRYVTLDGSLAAFKRDGEVGFGSAAVTYERPIGPILVAGNLRYDYLKVNLDGYRENSSSDYALTWGAASQVVQVLSFGVRGETTFEYSWGKLIPSGRLEYRQRMLGDYVQSMAYSDLTSRQYQLQRAGVDHSAMSASFGARAVLGTTELGAEFGTSGTALDSFSGSELRLMLRKRF